MSIRRLPPLNVHHLWLIVVLLVAFLLRAGWGLTRPANGGLDALPDQVEYVTLARNFLNDGQLAFYDHRDNIQQWVWAYRTPGYPLFLAACHVNLRLVRLAQALIDTLTALAAYLLARQWLGRRAGLLAAWAVALNPFLIYFSALILTETLYTGMLAWGMVLLTRPSTGRASPENDSEPKRGGFHRPPPFMAAGIFLLALAVLVRPSGLFMPVILAAAAAWLNRRLSGPYHSTPWPAVLGTAFVAAIVTLMVLTPWAVRNNAVLGRWVWTTTNGGITLYDGWNPIATGASDQSFLQNMPQVRYPHMGEVARSAYFSKLAKQWAWEHPWRVIRLTAVKIARTWSPIPLSSQYGDRPIYVMAAAVFSIPLDLLILIGLIAGGLSRRIKLFLLLPVIYFTLVHGLTVGSLRYRMPMEGPLAVLAGCGAIVVWRRLTRRRPVEP